MYQIVKKTELAHNIFLMDVLAPRVANSAFPGQFVIVIADQEGERIPLTICDYDKNKGTVTIVTQVVGASSSKICNKNVGESFYGFAGPLGVESEFIHESEKELKNKKRLFIAGGVGAAPVFPQLKYLSENGAKADVIIGAKTKNLLILENEMKECAGEVYITTDDGSKGFKGLVTQKLEELISEGKKYDEIIAIGPMIMMKFVALTTKKYDIKTIASLNTLMVDGTGMCGACRVSVGGEIKFTCIDGPEFDAHLVDFDQAMSRMTMYRDFEYKKNCQCIPKV